MPLVVITGGSRGIGQVLARRLVGDPGYEVVAVGSVALELTSFSSVDAFVAGLKGRQVDVLVNNAGAMFATHALTADGVERTMAVNCVGPLRLTEALNPARVVNVVTSPLGKLDLADLKLQRSYRCFAAYLAAKLAFMHVVRAWAAEGRRVQSVYPGLVRTPMLKPPAGPMRYLHPVLRLFADEPEVPAGVLASVVQDATAPADALYASGRRATWAPKLCDPQRNAQVAGALRALAGLASSR